LRETRKFPPAVSACSLTLSLPAECLRYGMLPNELQAAVRQAGLVPERLTIQIGQNAIVPGNPSVLWALNRLRVGGFGLSLDDYCSGYSSIQLLSQLPFTEIKLDRDLIGQAARGQQARIILAAAIEMGLQLGMRTVADGVESDAQLRMLRSMGCERAQGPAVSMAFGIDDLPDWLQWEAPRLPVVLAA
jgi:EAL domain-containing protein (putative c-di-GMP-specific phosphodiesterase class I)